MTEDISSLQIRILYDSISQAERRLKTLEGTAGKASKTLKQKERSANSLMGSLGRLALTYVSLNGAISAFQQIIRKTAEFQQLNAQLMTATGSANNAAVAFDAIKKFAAATPYDLQQVTTAFISLVNRGLTPSVRALTSYGNTASSMGFQLSEMVLAVSNATAGEYENLKRFGIRAQKEGDNIKFTFRGVTTEVKNNINEIEKYFIELGEKSFGGGMERQMQTLTGAFSNFGDAWEVMLATIGEAGLGDLVEETVRQATASISEFTAYLESGQFDLAMQAIEERLKGQGLQWQALGETIMSSLTDAQKVMETFVDDAETDANEWDGYWRDAFTNFPAHVKFAIESSQLYLEGFVRKAQSLATEFRNTFDPGTATGESTFVNYGAFLSPETWFSWDAFNEAKEAVDGYNEAAAYLRTQGKGPSDFMRESFDTIDAEIEAEIDALVRETDEIKRNTDAFNKRADAITRMGPGGDLFVGPPEPEGGVLPPIGAVDPLAGFRVGDGGSDPTAGAPKAKPVRERTPRTVQADFEKEVLKSIYESETQNVFDQLDRQENDVRASYEQRMRDILEMTSLTESQKLALMTKAESEYAAAQIDFQRKRQAAQLELAEDFFGNISEMAGAFGKRGAKIAKVAAIIQTTIKTYESATSAYAALAGIPYVGPALGAAAAGAAIAAGLSNVARIKATDEGGGYAGAYATGGIVGGNSKTGDKLTARVNSGEMILNEPQQKRLFEMANGPTGQQAGGNRVSVIVNNLPGQDAKVETSPDGEIIRIAVMRTLDTLVGEANNGGGRFVPALSKKFNMKRIGQ